MKRDVAADIISFIGFKGDFDGSSESAALFRLRMIYDSNDFDSNHAFDVLNSLGKSQKVHNNNPYYEL